MTAPPPQWTRLPKHLMQAGLFWSRLCYDNARIVNLGVENRQSSERKQKLGIILGRRNRIYTVEEWVKLMKIKGCSLNTPFKFQKKYFEFGRKMIIRSYFQILDLLECKTLFDLQLREHITREIDSFGYVRPSTIVHMKRLRRKTQENYVTRECVKEGHANTASCLQVTHLPDVVLQMIGGYMSRLEELMSLASVNRCLRRLFDLRNHLSPLHGKGICHMYESVASAMFTEYYGGNGKALLSAFVGSCAFRTCLDTCGMAEKAQSMNHVVACSYMMRHILHCIASRNWDSVWAMITACAQGDGIPLMGWILQELDKPRHGFLLSVLRTKSISSRFPYNSWYDRVTDEEALRHLDYFRLHSWTYVTLERIELRCVDDIATFARASLDDSSKV